MKKDKMVGFRLSESTMAWQAVVKGEQAVDGIQKNPHIFHIFQPKHHTLLLETSHSFKGRCKCWGTPAHTLHAFQV